MAKKFKFKFSTLVIVTLMIGLSGCDKLSNFEKQGYSVPVVYNLGEGKYDGNNRDTNTLTVYYQPNSYITDFTKDNRYNFTHKDGENCTYELEGWYFDSEFTERVDFETYILPSSSNTPITIYANWVAVYDKYFDIYFVDNDGNVQQWTEDGNTYTYKSMKWDVDEPFVYSSKTMKYPSTETYTYIEAYKDEALTQLVDDSYVLSKEDGTPLNLPVYLKWVKGDYKIVNTAKEFKNWFGYNNLYINSDIDMAEEKLNYVELLKDRTILGNNHVISNLVCSTYNSATGTNSNAIYGGLADVMENVTIQDLTFSDVTYTIEAGRCKGLYVAPLAGKLIGTTIKNVSIVGSVQYANSVEEQYFKENPKGPLAILSLTLDKVAYDVDNQSVIETCSLQITNTKEEKQ